MRYSAICGLMLFFGVAPPADAGLITYADYASWSSAVTGISTVKIPNVTAFLGFVPSSVTYDGVTFSTDRLIGDPRMFSVSTAITTTFPIISTQQATGGLGHLVLTLPEPVTALAFNYGTARGSALNLIILSADEREVFLGTGDGYETGGFVGVVVPTPFDTVYLVTDYRDILNVGNVAYADAAAVPEPGTFTLMGLGALGLAGFARRRNSLI